MGKQNKTGLEKKLAFKKEMKEKRKGMKEMLKSKRAKLIVKNLPFKSTEENLKVLFEQHGEIESVNILKKADGKMVGCAFIQFKLVQKAAKARHHLNGHLFLDRPIEVDFAKAKNKYKKDKKQKVETQVKSDEVVDLSIVKTEDNEDTGDAKKEDENNLEDTKSNSDIESDSSNFSESESESDSIPEIKDQETEDNSKKPRVVSNDVSEGKTIFVKNVPFSATNEDLKQCMLQYGHVYYALICIDRLTEHSKGTAFVKFKNKEDADKCLEAGTELTLQGNILDCHAALHKQDLQRKEKEKNIKLSDSRNLYLVKEGVILANTKASEGVSASDMTKRLQLEQYKTQILRNLNMYISRTRLIIHNIPPMWNDIKLKALFKKHSSPSAVIREARIMRDMRNVDSKGIGKSKEYGFVSYTTHEDALNTLRALNNNPTIFSINKRPIVAFSIENKAVMKAKEKRLQRSKTRNPNSKDYNPNLEKGENQKKQLSRQESNVTNTENIETSTVSNKFTGVSAKPGPNKMRSRYNLKTQAKLHFENIQKAKKKMKTIKTLDERRKDFRKQPRQKLPKKRDEVDTFSVLVSKYKENLKSVPLKTSKWYE